MKMLPGTLYQLDAVTPEEKLFDTYMSLRIERPNALHEIWNLSIPPDMIGLLPRN